MGWNLFGGLIPPTANHTEEKERRRSGDSGTEEEFEILERGEIKERRYSGDSGNESQGEAGVNNSDTEYSAVTTLEFQLTQFLLSQVKAGENNRSANSGKQAQLDLERMDFVINGQTISKEYVRGLYCQHNHLILNENYRTFAKQVFTGMFNHAKEEDAKAEVPDDHILEELITSCNQAGYSALLAIKMHNILIEYQLFLNDYDKRTTYIDCSDKNCVRINQHKSSVVHNFDDPEKEICELGSSLEFTLKSQNDRVEYENGKVTLTIPEQLKDYKVGRKSLLGDIKGCFEDAGNAVVESLVENIGEGPKSFVADPPAEVDLDPFDVIPENAVFDLGHIPELVKKAVDDKDVNALANHIGFFQGHVTHVSPKEGLSVVEKTLEIVSGFIEEQGEAWRCYPTVPVVSKVYAITERLQGYISYEDYNKAINLEKVLNSIITRLSNNEKSSGSKTALSKENSNTVNSTEISTQESVTANNCKGNKENKQQTPYKVIIPTKYKSVSNIIPIAASNNQSENPAPKNQQPQENVDRRENIMNNEKASIEEAIGNDYRRGKMGKNSAKKRKERIKRSKEEKKKNEQEKEMQFRELYVGKNDGSKVITEVDSSKKKQAPGQLAGYVEQTGGLGSSNDNNPLDNGTNGEKNSTFKTDEQDTKPAPILEPVPSVASENSEQEDGTQTTTRQQEPNPIPTPTPVPTPNLTPTPNPIPTPTPTPNLTPTPNPIPTPTPEPTPQPTPALKPTLIPSVANKISEQEDDTKTNGKLPNNPGNGSITATQNTQKTTVATWAFAVAGILAGAAAPAAYFAFSVSLLTTGIIAGVAACCLIVAIVTYCYRPKTLIENDKVERVNDDMQEITPCCS